MDRLQNSLWLVIEMEKKTIGIRQAESKEALAIYAHLSQIVRAASREQCPVRPVDMRQEDLIIASASLRALFFDDTKILINFLSRHEFDFSVDAVETNLNLMLLAYHIPDEMHVSDFIASILLDRSMHEHYQYDKPNQTTFFFQDGSGYADIMKNPKLWVPDAATQDRINTAIGLGPNWSPFQMFETTRKKVSIHEWGKVRIGYLKNIPIRRNNIITYVANELGGVHYNIARKPPNKDDAEKYQVLATAYDWNDESIMHAGLVAVGIACNELLNTPEIWELYSQLGEFHYKRQGRLMRQEKLSPKPSNND